MTDWDNHEAEFVYDNAGRHVATIRDGQDGFRSRYDYDAAGRLTGLTHRKSEQTLARFAYTVDARGNRTQALEAIPHPSGASTTISHDDDGVIYKETWSSVGGYHETSHKRATLRLIFFGDENVQLKMGEGPNHSFYDVYIGGSLWKGFDGYSATAGERHHQYRPQRRRAAYAPYPQPDHAQPACASGGRL